MEILIPARKLHGKVIRKEKKGAEMTEETQQKVVAAYQIANQGDYDHARMLLEEALYDEPDNLDAWFLLADLAEDRDEALQCYQMVLEASPGNWIAQQRLKLLFSNPVPESAPQQETYGYFEADVESEDILTDFDDFMEAEMEDTGAKNQPTLKESFQAHRKIVIRAGIGLAVFLGLLLLTWAGSIVFIAWRMGYLIIGG